MTKQYDNELKGVLFKNEDKETETHPDYKGSATIKGVDYFMDVWVNTADSGRRYMSVKFKAKEKQPQAAAPAPRQQPQKPQRRDDFSDSIPF